MDAYLPWTSIPGRHDKDRQQRERAEGTAMKTSPGAGLGTLESNIAILCYDASRMWGGRFLGGTVVWAVERSAYKHTPKNLT